MINASTYYKATLDKGVSGYDGKYRYKIGMNIHPCPDRKDDSSCGIGIHLAKTLALARTFVPRATEFYLAEAGVILGEDSQKVRCASCVLVRKLTGDELVEIRNKEEIAEQARRLKERELEKERRRLARERAERQALIQKIKNTRLIDAEWLKRHMNDYTSSDIQNLTIVVKTPAKTLTLNGNMRRKDRKYLLQNAVA